MARFFLRRDSRFFDLLERSSSNLVQGAKSLVELLENYRDLPEKMGQITDLEHHGDTITHQIMEQLHLTFVTPLDREDIVFLAQRLDDVLDNIEAAVLYMNIYRVSQPTERARELARLILKAADVIFQAMQLLRQHRKLRSILALCVEVNSIENEADQVYRSALAELFQDTMAIQDVMKWREIYEQLESAADRAEDVANVLEGVVLKHA